MKRRRSFYFCSNCKKIVHEVKELYIVEEALKRTFCSDTCIVQFFSHIISYLEKEEHEIRKSLNIVQESVLQYVDEKDLIDSTLMEPDETWVYENDISEELYTLIKKHSKADLDFFMVIMCYMYKGAPSFVFFQTTTSSLELLEEYRTGRKISERELKLENISTETEIDEALKALQLPPELLQDLEFKKSVLLSKLLGNRLESDIPIDEFPKYDKFIEDTLRNPDEVYQYLDEEGDTLFVYIKTSVESGTSFYFIAICMRVGDNYSLPDEMVLPILAFPSLDPNLCQKYQIGEKVSGNTLN